MVRPRVGTTGWRAWLHSSGRGRKAVDGWGGEAGVTVMVDGFIGAYTVFSPICDNVDPWFRNVANDHSTHSGGRRLDANLNAT